MKNMKTKGIRYTDMVSGSKVNTNNTVNNGCGYSSFVCVVG